MSGLFGPNEVALMQRIVDLAAADLGITDENEKALIEARTIALAERGKWDFDLLMAHAKGNIQSAEQDCPPS